MVSLNIPCQYVVGPTYSEPDLGDIKSHYISNKGPSKLSTDVNRYLIYGKAA